jgi:hypothetical protein
MSRSVKKIHAAPKSKYQIVTFQWGFMTRLAPGNHPATPEFS